MISGDPLHPAGGELFGYFLWNAQDLLRQKAEQATYGVSPNPLHLWAALKEANVIVWILAFAGLAFKRTPPAIRAMQFTFLAYFAFWFFVTQVTRYLAPVCAVGTFLSCYTLYRCYALIPAASRAKFARDKGTIAGYVLLALLISYAADRFHKHHDKMVHWDEILEREPGYMLFSEANTLIPRLGPRLVQIGFENAVYFFDGRVIGDWFGPGRYSNMLDCRAGPCKPVDAESMKQRVTEFGSRMLAVSTEQYPGFDPRDYSKYFELVKKANDGVLLILK